MEAFMANHGNTLLVAIWIGAGIGFVAVVAFASMAWLASKRKGQAPILPGAPRPEAKSANITTGKQLLALLPVVILAGAAIVYWQVRTDRYQGAMTVEERAMLLTGEDLVAYGFPPAKDGGAYRKWTGANRLPTLHYVQGNNGTPGFVECYIARVTSRDAFSPSLHRPGENAAPADEILTGVNKHRCWSLRTTAGVEGSSCTIRVGMTDMRFTFFGKQFRERGSLNPVLTSKLHLLEAY